MAGREWIQEQRSLDLALTMDEIRYFLLISKAETAAEQCKAHHTLLNKIVTGRVEERLEKIQYFINFIL